MADGGNATKLNGNLFLFYAFQPHAVTTTLTFISQKELCMYVCKVSVDSRSC